MLAVSLSPTQDVAGIQIRILFDDSVLESPQVVRGPLANEDMFLDASTPEAGTISVVLATGSGQHAISGGSSPGVAFYLRFRVRTSAVLETYTAIRFDNALSPPFPVLGSSLSSPTGVELAHTRENGFVFIGQETKADDWILYQ
ncbi:hypothetical protein JW916_16755 [Candidatus Sumerlaeota bacterium]|nr:hypothetical protein [Candidatus Sumerlaeota bacterium]